MFLCGPSWGRFALRGLLLSSGAGGIVAQACEHATCRLTMAVRLHPGLYQETAAGIIQVQTAPIVAATCKRDP
eukprot:1896736-Amphidinium_carterae.1